MSDLTLSPTAMQQMPPLQRLADARRILEINIDANPFLDAEGRREIRLAKRIAWATLGEVAELLVETFNTVAGDPDIELNGDELDGSSAEDDYANHPQYFGPGCPIADSDSEHDGREEESGQ